MTNKVACIYTQHSPSSKHAYLFMSMHMCLSHDPTNMHPIVLYHFGTHSLAFILLPLPILVLVQASWTLAWPTTLWIYQWHSQKEGMYFNSIFPLSTASQMKWYLRLIYLVQEWNLLSFTNNVAPWLLHITVSGFVMIPVTLLTKFSSHRASFATCISGTYSALVLDNAIMFCFLGLQDIAP